MKPVLFFILGFSVLFAIGFLFYRPFLTWLEKKRLKHRVGKVLYRLARDEDYYVLHQVALEVEGKVIHFDHILFANKYIYCIADAYFQKAISGSYDDHKWFLYDRKGRFNHISNPLEIHRKRIEYLMKYFEGSDDLFVGVLAVNNSLLLDEMKGKALKETIQKVHQLRAYIREKEKDTSVRNIRQDELEKVVKMIHSKNKHK